MVMNPAQLRDQQQSIDLATQLIGQNTPIETIIQQTGLPRNLVTDLVNSQINIDRPTTPMISPQGIQTLAFDSKSMPKPDTNLGTDIADYVTGELGFDGTDNDGNLSIRQMFNASNAAWMSQNQEDTEGAEKLLEVQKLTDEMGFTDDDLKRVFGQAAKQVYDLDYEQFIQEPDKKLPIMLFGLSLAEAGTKGDDWPTALSQATLKYFFNKRKDERSYEKALKTVGLKKQEKINDLVMQFSLLDYKNKAALNLALQKSQLEAPKAYDISNSGDFTDKETVFLDEPSFSYYAKKFPGNIRESKNQDNEAYSLISKDGGLLNVWMDQDEVNAFDPAEKGGAILRKGHSEASNLKLYSIAGADGEDLGTKWLSPAQYNFREGQGEKMTQITGAGKPRFVIRKDNNEGTWVTDAEILANRDAYLDDSGFNFSVGADGSIDVSQGSAGMARADKRRGQVAYDDILETVNATETAVDNYFISSQAQDKLIKDFLEANPGAEDLPFNNLAGRAVKFVDGLRINLKAFSDLATSDKTKGGYTFYGPDGKPVDFDVYKNNIVNSDEFKEALNSPLAQFFKDNGVVGQALEATFFDLAMQGAASYSPNKGGVDLRAISDYETRLFLIGQGGQASSLSAFLEIRNNFARNLINRNRNFLRQQIRPTNLLRITDADGKQDTTKTDALTSDVESMLKKLDDYESEYQESYTFGRGSPVVTRKFYVGDKTIDPDNPNVIGFNAEIPAGLNVPVLNYQFQKGYLLDDSTEKEGTFREILNKYTALQQSNPAQFTTLVDNLNANLSEEEMVAFRLFLLEAERQGK